MSTSINTAKPGRFCHRYYTGKVPVILYIFHPCGDSPGLRQLGLLGANRSVAYKAGIDSPLWKRHVNTMLEWLIFLRGLSIGLIFALIVISVLLFWGHYLVRTLVFFSLGIIGYLLAPLLYGNSPFFYLSAAVADTTPLAFLLFAQAVFDDHKQADRNALIAGAIYLTAGYISIFQPLIAGGDPEPLFAPWLASRLVIGGVLTYAFYIILRNWRADLVEPRRRMRAVVTVILCVYILAVVMVDSLMVGNAVPEWVEVLNSAGIVISTLFFIGFLTLMGPAELRISSSTTLTKPTPLAISDQQEIDSIIAAMEQRHVYRDMELTISSLGINLSIPEHRLRQHINRVMGYRNFNDFLNRYRIAEATERLADPAFARTPVLTIAMDAGYRSMTTFNKAFRARHNQTPVEYRQNQPPIS
ncbi:MAG: helix-turn-helix domain-containing protein [Halioglobus sp.]